MLVALAEIQRALLRQWEHIRDFDLGIPVLAPPLREELTPREVLGVGSRIEVLAVFEKMGIRLTQVAPISCGLEIFLGSVTG